MEVVPPFKSLHETLVCDHSNERYLAVLSCGTGGSNLQVIACVTIQTKAIEQYFYESGSTF